MRRQVFGARGGTTRRLALAAFGAALAVVAVPIAFGAGTEDAGTFALRAEFAVNSQPGSCVSRSDASTCSAREGKAVIPGLGEVLESYEYPVLRGAAGCSPDDRRILPYTVRFTVGGKGEIFLAVPGSSELCLAEGTDPGESLGPTYGPITITGGTGRFADAAGTVTLVHHLSFNDFGGATGTDEWAGTLTVPGLEFDLKPPTLRGVVDKMVRAPKRAKRVSVKYGVTARDDVDGAVRASCTPRSGSRFKIGRTVVTCSATDTSANTVKAKFRILVRARR